MEITSNGANSSGNSPARLTLAEANLAVRAAYGKVSATSRALQAAVEGSEGYHLARAHWLIALDNRDHAEAVVFALEDEARGG
jgi:hypothetical protein